MSVSWPWALALAVPAARRVAWRWRRATPALRLSRLGVLRLKRPTLRARLGSLPWVLRLAALVLGTLALSRPQWGTHFEEVVTQGVDIVMTLDISGSMHAEDMKPKDRLSAAKEVFGEFIKSRKHDRIGMVIFSGRSVTQCPLTTDQRILDDLLEAVDFESAPRHPHRHGHRHQPEPAPPAGAEQGHRTLDRRRLNAGPVDPDRGGRQIARRPIHAVGVGSSNRCGTPCASLATRRRSSRRIR